MLLYRFHSDSMAMSVLFLSPSIATSNISTITHSKWTLSDLNHRFQVNHAFSLAIRSHSCCCLHPSLPRSRPPAMLSRLPFHSQRPQQHDLRPEFYLAGHIVRSSIL